MFLDSISIFMIDVFENVTSHDRNVSFICHINPMLICLVVVKIVLLNFKKQKKKPVAADDIFFDQVLRLRLRSQPWGQHQGATSFVGAD